LTAGIGAGAPLGRNNDENALSGSCGLAGLGICGTLRRRPTRSRIGAVRLSQAGVELYGAQAKLGLDRAAADINAAGAGFLGRLSRSSIATTATGRTSPPRAPKVVEGTACWRWWAPSRRRTRCIVPGWLPARTPRLYGHNYEGACAIVHVRASARCQPGAGALLPYMTQTFGSD